MNKRTKILLSGIVIGAVAAICGIIYCMGKSGNILDNFEDDFGDDDEFDDAFADDED
jgi:hypothetical protein